MNRSAFAFLTVEAVSIFAFFFCEHCAKKTALDAGGYAWLHAGASGPIADADDYYWKLVGSFMDVQEYNTVMDLNRTPEKKIIDENRSWHWDDKSSQDAYNALRSSSRSFGIVSSFFIGALMLNRVAAFIHVRTVTRNRGVQRTAVFIPEIRPLPAAGNKSVSLAWRGSF